MGLTEGKAQLTSLVVLSAHSSSQCECVLPAPLARTIWACPHSKGPCFSALICPCSPPSLQESADCFLALLLELLTVPVDSEMRLCQQSLLVRVLPSSSFTPSGPWGQKPWGCLCMLVEHSLRTLLLTMGSDAFLSGQAVSPIGVFVGNCIQKKVSEGALSLALPF